MVALVPYEFAERELSMSNPNASRKSTKNKVHEDTPAQTELSSETLNVSGSTKVPEGLNPSASGDGPRGFPWELILQRNVKHFKLLSFLTTKLLLSPETGGLSFDETVALFGCYHTVKEKMTKDPTFREKHFLELAFLEDVLRKIDGSNEFPLALRWSRQIEDTELSDLGTLFLGRRGYSSQHGQLLWRKAFSVRYRFQEFPRQFAPKRWMGVGHRDSGGLRVPGYDASPRWQDVYKCLLSPAELADEILEDVTVNP